MSFCLQTWLRGFDSWQGKGNVLFAIVCRLALGLTQDPYPMDIGGAHPDGKAAEASASIK
jgi:hypothetical protein